PCPTDIQSLAWPLIADGRHLLVTAPTGSGKTLTAFLWTINQFITGALETGTTRVLYISPLKALNSDIRRNLLEPLASLKTWFADRGESFPEIRVQTRSGDTPQDERRRMLRRPPEILITTPESLNLLLTSASGLACLRDLSTVILDEIHSVVDNKRGVWLMSAIERLVPLSGEFQRIALSATVNPMETVARMVGGYCFDGDYQRRDVQLVRSSASKHYAVTIRYPEEAAERPMEDKIWDYLAVDLVRKINANHSTLIFVNSRAVCEKLTYKINDISGHTLAWPHHGSLARELRTEVEEKLKSGELAAIVATSTLEMGIDIGALDEVLLVQSPGAISSAIQRVGRAGHSVGETSRCTIYPTHPTDFLEAAVLAKAITERNTEPVTPVSCPLDVLAQVILSMASQSEQSVDGLYQEIRCSYAFHDLKRRAFDLVINMLAGRYAENHIRELKPRISLDRITNRIRTRKGAVMALYLSGGVIPDRGYFQIRHAETQARIGELDEEFVWEASVGDQFSFGNQVWQIRKITHNDVVVAPGKPSAIAPPFYRSESISRDFFFAGHILNFLERADQRLEEPDFALELKSAYFLEDRACEQLLELLYRQKQHCRAPLPHRHHLLTERVNSGPGSVNGHQLVLHTGWGARINRPLALALESAWQSAYGERPQVYVSNECLVFQLPHPVPATELFGMIEPENLELLLRERLEDSGFFGARFRENAGRAMLLSRQKFNERKPLWMSRLQSKKLLESVSRYPDFPILIETWRACLQDEFDLPQLRELLDEIRTGVIRLSEVETDSPSPFAHAVAWGQINEYMYQDDSPAGSSRSALSDELLAEVVFDASSRPAIPLEIAQDYELRRKRLIPGYQPETTDDLVEWVKERTMIPASEWALLTEQLSSEVNTADARLCELVINGKTLIVAIEDRDSLAAALLTDEEGLLSVHLANWLQFNGPVTLARLEAELGVAAELLEPVIHELMMERTIITGCLLEDSAEHCLCDSENFEALLRIRRYRAREVITVQPVAALPHFLYRWQTRDIPAADPLAAVTEAVQKLELHPAKAALWEQCLLPSRVPDYRPALLDQLFLETDLMWIGTGQRELTLVSRANLDLVSGPAADDQPLLQAFPGQARFDFNGLLDLTGASASSLTEQLWSASWQAQLSSDGFVTVRKGLETGFAVPEMATAPLRGRGQRRHFQQWRSAVPVQGNWFRIHYPEPLTELTEKEAVNKDKVRLLLDRFGILYRELLQREAPGFQWKDVFRSLRLMELSGEVTGGYFFDGIPGPQFASPGMPAFLSAIMREPGIFWINACDPVSLAGTGIGETLPRRVAGNYLVYHGTNLVMVVERQGKSLDIRVPPDCEDLPHYYRVLHHLVNRPVQPIRQLTIQTINNDPAQDSPYLVSLRVQFDLTHDHKHLHIQRAL
ncbi:MAG: DEAD/DEAH box helicase, partial [Pseudomonadales bacterium]|nr:DEAD/DEAH box helicase [Pseudomonadales bacterium]